MTARRHLLNFKTLSEQVSIASVANSRSVPLHEESHRRTILNSKLYGSYSQLSSHLSSRTKGKPFRGVKSVDLTPPLREFRRRGAFTSRKTPAQRGAAVRRQTPLDGSQALARHMIEHEMRRSLSPVGCCWSSP